MATDLIASCEKVASEIPDQTVDETLVKDESVEANAEAEAEGEADAEDCDEDSDRICCECDGDLEFPWGTDKPADNALQCTKGHRTCMKCVIDSVIPSRQKCNLNCVMIEYVCFYCEEHVCVSRFQLLAVMRQSYKAVFECFPCAEERNHWASCGASTALLPYKRARLV